VIEKKNKLLECKKNIWIFNHYVVTPDMTGGTRHYDLALELANQGNNLVLFASSYNHFILKEMKDYIGKNYLIENISNIKIVWIKTTKYKKNNWKRILNMFVYSFRVIRAAKKLRKNSILEKPDIVMGSSVHLFAVLSALVVSRKNKAKFIMEVRDLWPATLIEFRKISKYHPVIAVFYFLEKFLAKRAEKIITVLPGAKEYYVEKKIKKKKIIWIPNGINYNNFKNLATERFKLFEDKISKDYFKVMYTGALGLANNVETFLRAGKIIGQKTNKIKLLIIGEGERKKQLINLKKKLNLNNVIFFDGIKKKDVPGVLFLADIFWIGTKNVKNLYKYGFSFNKLFEYMASKRPIVFSVDAEYNPVKESGAGIVIEPENSQSLADAILKLFYMSKTEREEIGIKGLKYVKDKHEWNILAKEFMKFVFE